MKQVNQKLNILDKIKAVLARELVVLAIGILIYTALFLLLDHSGHKIIIAHFVIVYAIFKVLYILFFTFKRLNQCLMLSNTFYDELTTYGFIIGILVISFALDFYCINSFLPGSFDGVDEGLPMINNIFSFLYFSMVTFSTIGFGDIVPLKFHSRFLVSLEVITSFIMIVFVVSNINSERIYKKHQGTQDTKDTKG